MFDFFNFKKKKLLFDFLTLRKNHRAQRSNVPNPNFNPPNTVFTV